MRMDSVVPAIEMYLEVDCEFMVRTLAVTPGWFVVTKIVFCSNNYKLEVYLKHFWLPLIVLSWLVFIYEIVAVFCPFMSPPFMYIIIIVIFYFPKSDLSSIQ